MNFGQNRRLTNRKKIKSLIGSNLSTFHERYLKKKKKMLLIVFSMFTCKLFSRTVNALGLDQYIAMLTMGNSYRFE